MPPRTKKTIIKPLDESFDKSIKSVIPISVDTDLKSFLFKIRDICRNKGVQMDEHGNIYADLIYDDLLFLKDVWHLAETGALTIDVDAIIGGFPIKDIKLNSIASLANIDIAHVGTVFRRLWIQLQRSNLKDIFDRDFALMGILKDGKLKDNYLLLLTALLEYTGNVILNAHEDTDPYEYFTQELKKAKSKYFGQFYTPMIVTESCVEEIKPKFGEFGLDPMAGTSKFMRTAATYIHKHQPEYSEWEAFQFMNTVEIESKIHRQGVLGTFIKYKQLPNLLYIRKGNAFDILPKEEEQYDWILGNPPYGGTVDGFEDVYYNIEVVPHGRRTKTIKTINPDIKHPFEFIKKDTSVLALQLIVNKLKIGGRAAVVFNGTIMNNTHRDVMKWFLNTCDLRKIIVNPSGTFQCTGIETYSLIFWKGSPTTNIEYIEFGTNKLLGNLTREELEERNYDIRPMFKSVLKDYGEINLVKISSLLTFTFGTVQASKSIDGEYKLLTLNDNATHNEYCYDGEIVAICNVPSGSSDIPKPKIQYYNGKCNCTTLMYVCNFINDTINKKYFWYFWYLNIPLLSTFYKGAANKSLDKHRFLDFKIPLPSIDIQNKIVKSIDRIFAPGVLNLHNTLITIEDMKLNMIDIMKSIDRYKFPVVKLSDVFNVKGGNAIPKKDLTGSLYPYYGCNGIIGYVDTYLYDGKYIICAQDGTIGSVYLVNKKFYPSNHTHILKSKNELIINNEFGLYFLQLYVDWKLLTTSIIPKVTQFALCDINIPLPPIEFQTKMVSRLDAMQSQINSLKESQNEAENNARFLLESYLHETEPELDIDLSMLAIS